MLNILPSQSREELHDYPLEGEGHEWQDDEQSVDEIQKLQE